MYSNQLFSREVVNPGYRSEPHRPAGRQNYGKDEPGTE